MLGAQVDGPQQATFNGLHLDFYPRVVWSPFFAITTDDLQVFEFSWCTCQKCTLFLHKHICLAGNVRSGLNSIALVVGLSSTCGRAHCKVQRTQNQAVLGNLSNVTCLKSSLFDK